MARTPDILTVPRWLPKLGATLGFFVFLAANMLLFMGRKVEALRPEWLLALAPDVYSHVSNLVIASLLHGVIGYLWLLLGVRLRHAMLLGLAIAVVNLVYEGFVPVLNTRDGIDAVYGLLGVAISSGFLLGVQRHGLMPNPAFVPKA